MLLDWWQYVAIFILGIGASVVNVLAGGGSNLILPTLMAFGLPADIANGSNRVGIVLQSLTAIRGFRKTGNLPLKDFPAIALPTIIGGIFGAVLAAVLPNIWLKPLLLGAMVSVSILMAIKPNLLTLHENETALKVSTKPWARYLLFGTGIYGGFVQAGVGFLMLPIFVGVLRYSLVQGNALKLMCTLGFTLVALAIFIWHGQVWWDVGLVLAAGNSLGAVIGVKTAINIAPNTMRRLLFIITLVAVGAALWR